MAATSFAAEPGSGQTARGATPAAIYAALFGSGALGTRPAQLVLLNETGLDNRAPDSDSLTRAYVRKNLPAGADLVDSLLALNVTRAPLVAPPELNVPVHLVSPATLDSIFTAGADGWRVFYQRFPNSGGSRDVAASPRLQLKRSFGRQPHRACAHTRADQVRGIQA